MRSKPKKPSKWLHPVAEEREYERYLEELARAIELLVRSEVFPLLDQRNDAIEDLPESAGFFEVIRQGFLSVLAKLDLTGVPAKVTAKARRVAGFNKQQFHKVIRKAYAVDIFVDEPWLVDLLKVWESENVGLIKSIPQQALSRMQGEIVASVQRGGLVKDLRDELVAEFGIAKDRATLIANDQIGKLNAQLTEQRQRQIGVDEYTWRGMLDERERDEHVAREGQVFSWAKPPEDGHPGIPIRCRCRSEPVLPLLGDLLALTKPTGGS